MTFLGSGVYNPPNDWFSFCLDFCSRFPDANLAKFNEATKYCECFSADAYPNLNCVPDVDEDSVVLGDWVP
jgi:hypothetical protein